MHRLPQQFTHRCREFDCPAGWADEHDRIVACWPTVHGLLIEQSIDPLQNLQFSVGNNDGLLMIQVC